MSEAIGPYTVDAAEGILRPAVGVVKTSVDPAPPTYDTSQAAGVASTIDTVRAFATPALALVEAQAYRSVIGATITFRGVSCFVANVEPDHRAAEVEGGTAYAVAKWTLVASLGWVP
jgi:hypothetical protein